MENKSKKYWEKRALALKADALKLAQQKEKIMEKMWAEAANETLREYEKLISPFKTADGGYDVSAIRTAFRTDQNFRIKYQRFSSHLSSYCNKIAISEEKLMGSLLFDIYKATELKLVDDSFNLINSAAVEKAVTTPWTNDGVIFSERIWKNTEKLKQEMQSVMLDSVLKGQNPRKTAKRLISRYDVGAHEAERLVRTETMAIYSEAAFNSYLDLGVEEYEILGDPDDHMCEPSGTRHTMDEFDVGNTAPPYHPNCKCCIVPVVD